MRRAAAEALGRIGEAPARWSRSIAVLKDPNEPMRRAAAEALGKIGTPAVEPLIAVLKDPNDGFRRAAAEALWIGDARAVATDAG